VYNFLPLKAPYVTDSTDYKPFGRPLVVEKIEWFDMKIRSFLLGAATYIPACYIAHRHIGSVICPVTCLLPYWRWCGSERNIVAPWGWHCFAETCRSHRKRKITKYIIQCIYFVNLVYHCSCCFKFHLLLQQYSGLIRRFPCVWWTLTSSICTCMSIVNHWTTVTTDRHYIAACGRCYLPNNHVTTSKLMN
jgi:hypothetical protein